MIRYHLLAEGRVQGVGFRYFVQGKAMDLNLTGTVKNLDNGMVEIEVQGSRELLPLFMEIIKEGNHYISVTNLIKTEIDVLKKEKTFRILY